MTIACGDASARGGPGESCLRTSQCDIVQGLACIAGMCTTDLGALAEAGMVPPMMDGGAPVDAPMADAPGVDGGPMGMDGGPMGTDGGPMGTDGGPMGTDGGPMGTDGGPMGTDGGPDGG